MGTQLTKIHGLRNRRSGKGILRFLPVSELEKLGRIPRLGSKPNFRHPVTRYPNGNRAKNFEDFEYDRTLFVFVSHRWCRPALGTRGHPDAEDNHKCKLIAAAAKTLVGKGALVPPHFQVAVWIDYSCVDQDTNPVETLEASLVDIMAHCDLMLTPVVDPHHHQWERVVSEDQFSHYKAEAWQEYWKRSWCRIEAMLAAATPVYNKDARAHMFNPGALRNACLAGRRPHFIYGTKELDEQKPCQALPPLANSFFHQYSPLKGKLTDERDRPLIERLTESNPVGELEEYYIGDRNSADERHGWGRQVMQNGSIYSGQYVTNKEHGEGILWMASGHMYEGQFVEGKKMGHGKLTFADGGFYSGMWVDDKRTGPAILMFPDGITMYRGEYLADKKHGHGTMTFADDRPPEEGIWVNNHLKTKLWEL